MLAALALSLAPLTPAQVSNDPPSPRVLLVDIDDVGYDLLQDTPTPTLDHLATHGRFFTSFTTTPMCSPTRATVMTGAYGSHPSVLVGDTIRGNATYALPAGPLIPLPALATANGKTAIKIGKWHLAPRSQPDHPRTIGWQHYAGVPLNIAPQGSYFDYDKVVDGVTTTVTDRYLTTDETDDALRCVHAGVDLISLSYHAAHTPFHVPPAHLHTFGNPFFDRDRARAMLQALDTELGRLVSAALANGYTILVFADNGTPQVIGGSKGTLFDEGIVNPLWAIGPGVVPGTDDSRIGSVDLYATIAEILGIDAGPPLRGPHSRSFAPALRGAPAYQRWTYSERFLDNGVDPRLGGTTWRRAVRGARYKYVVEPDLGGERFHDLWSAAGETIDLLDSPSLAPDAQAALDHFRAVFARL